jgi:hypothetical protein
MTWRAPVTLAANLLLGCAAGAQAGVRLSLHEARVLAEHTPAFLEAATAAECPNTEDSGLTGDVAAIVVRAGCQLRPSGSGWIETLFIDLKTGMVATVPGGSETIDTPELAELRRALFKERSEARIPAPEAACLLRRVPTPAISSSCKRVNVVPQGDELFRGTIQNTCSSAPQDGGLQLIIDRYSGAVTDATTENEYHPAGLWDFEQELVTAHAPPTLTVEDAAHLAGSGPVAAALKGAGQLKDTRCLALDSEGLKNADELWLLSSGGCGADKDSVELSVDLVTGIIWVFHMGLLDSPEIREGRQAALAEAKSRKTAAIAAVAKECR